jgi:hypothetical protein
MSAQPIKLSWSLTSQVELFEPPAHRRKVGVGQSTDGLTRCSSAGCEWCAATQRRSASVISSSSQTNARPAAHCARGVVFQCTPRSAAASSSGQSREAALEGRAAARPPRSPRSFTCSPRPAHPAGRADAGRHPGPTAQAVDLPRLSAASPTPPVDRRGTVDQARNGMSTPSISQRSAVALRRQAPRSRTLSANARIWPTGWARPAGPVRRSVGNGTPRPSA